MTSLKLSKEVKLKGGEEEYTNDGTVDFCGMPANRANTGKWPAAIMLLLNQGLATLAFFGVGVNLVLFLTRVLHQNNAEAANNVSIWTGTVYIFSLFGAFLSDSYWGRFKTCIIFQGVYVTGLVLLSLVTQLYLIKPKGCGDRTTLCGEHSTMEIKLFYISVYMIALGYGGYQPNIISFGADQFDEHDLREKPSKPAFFSYFYLALNLGSFFSNTVLDYFEDDGMWALGFWASAASAFAGLVLFLGGTARYRHFRSSGNPITRFSQVIVAASKKWRVEMPENEDALYEGDDESSKTAGRKMLHTHGFKFLDKAALITSKELDNEKQSNRNPWRLCPISQVEEVKCILRLLPIWLCTILYSVEFTQMASMFVVQGDAMKTTIGNFRIPAASMSGFDIMSVAIFVFLYRQFFDPLVKKFKKIKGEAQGITQLQRMGIGLSIAGMAMLSAAIVECYRLEYARKDCTQCEGSSSLSIFWQVPQYSLIGASEVFMYVGQLEFFGQQTPDGLKSFGSALCMASISLGNYVSSLLVSIVMKISTSENVSGWIPANLNDGHLDRFYFLLASLTVLDLVAYIACARRYKGMKHGEMIKVSEEDKCDQV
ncbi:Protein NRT1/ PTR FAMILY 7.3 [Capsicum annuum]|uniref:protein NRT1/ PTR FAMILY 7.3 n=1 Tax=Capsicum annuum TaxID=4072 RepID=UPI001FB146AD|nr:protein NRT1/ PTR FAMILY 7.3 [Capsicum annuum]KAF3632281.1 Protein NRT1/ PTR FAMILY 7.3 [Capsicum annuum]